MPPKNTGRPVRSVRKRKAEDFSYEEGGEGGEGSDDEAKERERALYDIFGPSDSTDDDVQIAIKPKSRGKGKGKGKGKPAKKPKDEDKTLAKWNKTLEVFMKEEWQKAGYLETAPPMKKKKGVLIRPAGKIYKRSNSVDSTAPCYFDWLPEEILNLILQYLSCGLSFTRLSVTCVRFHEAMQDPTIWLNAIKQYDETFKVEMTEEISLKDWKERYIELYFFHTPGRCSICKAKTENERIEALKVRMCTTCASSQFIHKSAGCTEFGLSANDFKKYASIVGDCKKFHGNHMYLQRNLRRAAVLKYGSMEKLHARKFKSANTKAKNKAGPIARSRLISTLLEERKVPGIPISGWQNYVYSFTFELSTNVEDYQKGTKNVPLKELVDGIEKHFRLMHRMDEFGIAVDKHVKEMRADNKDKHYLLPEPSAPSRYGVSYRSFNSRSTQFDQRYPEIAKFRLGTSEHVTVEAMLAYLIKMEAVRKPQMAKLKAKVIAAIEDDEHESRWRSLWYRSEFRELSDMATIPEDAAAMLIAMVPKRAKEEPVDVAQLDADIRKLGIEPPTAKEQALWLFLDALDSKSLPGIRLPEVGVKQAYYGSQPHLGEAVVIYAKATAGDMARMGASTKTSIPTLPENLKALADWMKERDINMTELMDGVSQQDLDAPADQVDPFGVVARVFKRYFICVATRKMPAAIDEAAVRQAVDDGIFAAGYGNPAAAAAAAALVCPLLQIYGDDAEQHNERCFCGKNGDKNLKKMLAVWSTRRNEVVEQFEKLTPLQPEKQPASTGPPHSGKQWTWKNLSPRTLYVAMKHLALPFKELLDDPYLSYKEPIEPVDPYDPYRARLLKPPVAKQSPFGRLFTAAEVTESVSDGQLLGASMASYEDHEATARLAVQAIIKKLKINADEFTFTRNYSTQRSPLVEILDTDLKEIKAGTIESMSKANELNGSGILSEAAWYATDLAADVVTNRLYPTYRAGTSKNDRDDLKKKIFRNAGIQFILGFHGKTAADFETAGVAYLAECAERSARLAKCMAAAHSAVKMDQTVQKSKAEAKAESLLSCTLSNYKAYTGPVQRQLPAACTQIIDSYVLYDSDGNGGDGLVKLTGLLKDLSKAKAQRPSVLKMLEEVHKTAQTDPKDFSPRFSFGSITLECAAGKCHCAKPRLVGDGTYGNLDDRFWSGLQTYITYHCQHSKGAASLKAVRQVAVFAAEMSKSADWKACSRDVKLHVESKCEALTKFTKNVLQHDPVEVAEEMDALAGQFKNLTRTTLHAVKQLDPNTKATRRRRGYYGHY